MPNSTTDSKETMTSPCPSQWEGINWKRDDVVVGCRLYSNFHFWNHFSLNVSPILKRMVFSLRAPLA